MSSSPSRILPFILLGLLTLKGCGVGVTRPKYEMNLAIISLQSAIEAKAPQEAPKLYRQAEYYFLKAKSAYLRKYFNKAKEYAIKSTKFSEKSEFISTIKKVTEGS